jgi:hypothetical protein
MRTIIKHNKLSSIWYIESNRFLAYGKIGAFIFKKTKQVRLYATMNGWYICSEYLMFNISINYDRYIQNCITQVGIAMQCISTGFFNRFKVIGLGQRAYFSKNLYVMELGYSHLVYYLMPLNTLGWKKKFKKQKFFTIFSSNHECINQIVCNIQNHRVPDIFSMNGIYKRSDDIEWKEGKKAFGFML